MRYQTLEAQKTDQTGDDLKKDLDELKIKYKKLKVFIVPWILIIGVLNTNSETQMNTIKHR